VADPDAAPVLGVADLTATVNGLLRAGFPDGVWVRGEVSGLTTRGPHQYFQLVERLDEGRASLDVSFFANHRNRLRPLLEQSGIALADGLAVSVYGSLDVYPPSGRLSLKMSGIDPRHTLGDLERERRDLLVRLQAEGVLRRNAERSLHPVPLRIGVVTSADSAAWADFRQELAGSDIAFRVLLADVRVQGATAPSEVSAAIRSLGRRSDLDAVVVVRGGGARSDLATFDTEPIARAIIDASLPVLTGLGHEIDRSVADEVAHLALKTPTAVAAFLVERVRAGLALVEDRGARIAVLSRQRLDEAEMRVARAAHDARHRAVSALQRADERLAGRQARLVATAVRTCDAAAARLDIVDTTVRLLDPATTLARGWSITRRADGSVLRSVADVAPGESLVTAVVDGTVTSTVTETTRRDLEDTP
jgi:exodeoxyribonuclease VII large subunit